MDGKIRDGTDHSNQRLQNAVDELWMYTDELLLITKLIFKWTP